jgi:hypothetical protein
MPALPAWDVVPLPWCKSGWSLSRPSVRPPWAFRRIGAGKRSCKFGPPVDLHISDAAAP